VPLQFASRLDCQNTTARNWHTLVAATQFLETQCSSSTLLMFTAFFVSHNGEACEFDPAHVDGVSLSSA